jgi:Na+-driven multidrug efflux pump
MFAIIPLAAIGTSVVSVSAAAYGAREFKKIKVIHSFSVLFGIGIAIIVSILTWLFSEQISYIFSYSAEGAHLAPTIAAFLATMCIFYPFVSPGLMSSSIFQGTGKGLTSLIINLLRNVVFMATSAYLLGITFGYGELGIWWGIVIGDILGGVTGFVWARIYISRLIHYS